VRFGGAELPSFAMRATLLFAWLGLATSFSPPEPTSTPTPLPRRVRVNGYTRQTYRPTIESEKLT